MKHLILPVCAASFLTAIPAAASTIPSAWIGQDATLVYDFTAQISDISDDAFFGTGDPIPDATATQTPFFGLTAGDFATGNLKLNVSFEDGFVDVSSSSCTLAGFDCNYNDIVSFELTDPETGAGSFHSTDFTSSSFFNFGNALEGEVLAEWTGTSELVIRALDFLILDFEVSGLPATPVTLVSMPIPSSLPLLGGALTIGLLGANYARRKSAA